jgi:hypothetical protein
VGRVCVWGWGGGRGEEGTHLHAHGALVEVRGAVEAPHEGPEAVGGVARPRAHVRPHQASVVKPGALWTVAPANPGELRNTIGGPWGKQGVEVKGGGRGRGSAAIAVARTQACGMMTSRAG